jgi:hypothetical protein
VAVEPNSTRLPSKFSLGGDLEWCSYNPGKFTTTNKLHRPYPLATSLKSPPNTPAEKREIPYRDLLILPWDVHAPQNRSHDLSSAHSFICYLSSHRSSHVTIGRIKIDRPCASRLDPQDRHENLTNSIPTIKREHDLKDLNYNKITI